MRRGLRQAAVLSSTCGLLALAGTLFWYQDWRYTIPARRPPGLLQPAVGETLAGAQLPAGVGEGKPVFLHFFNPACPCSRFNVDHVRSLVTQFGARVRFVAVLEGEEDEPWLRRHYEKTGIGAKAVVDTGGAIARAAGVYATPQGVLLDGRGRLYFRGNYNLSRYCTDPATEFARLAIENLLEGNAPGPPRAAAGIAYGCPFPRLGRRGGEREGEK